MSILEELSQFPLTNSLFISAFLKLISENERVLIFEILLSKMKKNSSQILNTLINYNIIEIKDDDSLNLKNDFKIGLENAMIDKIEKFFFENSNISIENFDSFLNINFINILESLVNCKNSNNFIISIFRFSNLIKNNQITQKGFSFLLQPRKDQMWSIIINGINYLIQEKSGNKIFFYQFLFEMGIHGQKYLNIKQNYSKDFQDFMNLLNELGIVRFKQDFIKKNETFNPNKFINENFSKISWYCTKDYYNLFAESISVDKFLILETNYKLYSFDTSKHTKSVLSLFSLVISQLPNLIISIINEDSCNKAFSLGIKAHQINNYLSDRSLKKVNKIILEQINIWERNRKRIFSFKSLLYSHFNNYNEFLQIFNFCKNKKILLDCDNEKRLIVIKEENQAELREFVKQRKLE